LQIFCIKEADEPFDKAKPETVLPVKLAIRHDLSVSLSPKKLFRWFSLVSEGMRFTRIRFGPASMDSFFRMKV